MSRPNLYSTEKLQVLLKEVTVILKDINETRALITGEILMSQNKLNMIADKTEVLVMGTPQMRASNCVPSITIRRSVINSTSL